MAPGESATLNLRVTRRDLSVWDVVSQNWVVPDVDGDYGVWVGESSDRLGVKCSSAQGSCGEAASPV